MKSALRRHPATVAAALLAAAFALATTACDRTGGLNPTQEADVAAEQNAFDAEQQAWRDQRSQDLVAPDGWTSLTGLHWIAPGAHYIGSSAGNGIKLSMGPAHLGMIDLRDAELRFFPEAGGDLTVDGEPVGKTVVLRADDNPAGPSVLGFDEGRGQASVILRDGRYALRVRHVDAPTRTGFAGLEYWPAERDWVVGGRFIPHPPGRSIDVANIIGSVEPASNPGAVEFQRDGQSYRLEAIDDGGGELFLVFADRTNGHGSYGAGRFLYAAMPDAEDNVVLDFNRAYSPPCAFTDFATCPLPPPENRLDLAVTAGEKNYTPTR